MKKVVLALIFVAMMCLQAQAADVTLQWDANTETDLGGYMVYYGSGPRTYLQPKGSGVNVPLSADENPDPAKVEYTVRGLTKALTYFAVTAYDTEVPRNESDYSNEVFTNFGPATPGGMKVKVIVEVIVP